MTATGRTVFVVVVAALVSAPSFPSSAAADQPVTLEHIQKIAARWRASFVNLRVVYELRGLPANNKPPLEWMSVEDFTAVPIFSRNEWIWADQGFDLLDNQTLYWTSGKTGVRTVDGFNGPKNLAFRAMYERPWEGTERLIEVGMQRVGGKPISWKIRAPLRGLYWANTAEWLPEILAKGEWTLEGMESVLGQQCARLSSRSPNRTTTNVDYLWLDLGHDALPRRFQQVPNVHRTVGMDFVVDELQQLEGGIWFPKRVRNQIQYDIPENQLITVTEVELNLEFDRSRFEPPSPVDGTLVTDGIRGERYRHGDTIRLSTDNDSKEAGTHNAASIHEENLFWVEWPFILSCASVVTLAIGIWLQRKEPRE